MKTDAVEGGRRVRPSTTVSGFEPAALGAQLEGRGGGERRDEAESHRTLQYKTRQRGRGTRCPVWCVTSYVLRFTSPATAIRRCRPSPTHRTRHRRGVSRRCPTASQTRWHPRCHSSRTPPS